jgi:DNA-binding transcriptional LysR family regulator
MGYARLPSERENELLNEMKVFVRAVELQSISAAARSLRLSAAAASHRVLQLEAQLGTRLLNRTTRRLQMTEAGRIFYDHAREVLESVVRAETSIANITGVPFGSLRVTAPVGLGRTVLGPVIPQFVALHPKIEVRLHLTDHIVDLLSESVDIAVRMACPTDSSFIVRKLAECPRVLCAASCYLDRKGTPTTPEELLAHNCLLLRFPGSTQSHWTLEGEDGPITLPVHGKFDADDGDVLTDWALQGEGIVLKPYWEVAEHIERGTLQVVLPEFEPTPVNLVLLYPHRQLLPASVRAFADFLIEKTRNLVEKPELRPVKACV